MAERWVVVRGRTSIVLPPGLTRAIWLISGLMHAYNYGKTKKTRHLKETPSQASCGRSVSKPPKSPDLSFSSRNHGVFLPLSSLSFVSGLFQEHFRNTNVYSPSVPETYL